jgi:hypothetical protein
MQSLNHLKHQRFLKDKNDHVVIIQPPNLPIVGWLVCSVLAYFIQSGSLHTGFAMLSKAFLFTWAYLEITQGVNLFRRLLGLVVMIGLLVIYFK